MTKCAGSQEPSLGTCNESDTILDSAAYGGREDLQRGGLKNKRKNSK
jgi:hypothetical protein